MSDIDDLLAEIDSTLDKKPQVNIPQKVQYSPQNKTQVKKKKCSNPQISNSINSQNKCNNIRCLKCDLKVQIFHNFQWSDDVDYLFFRNYFSDDLKLQQKLIKNSDKSSYACQCAWITIDGQVSLNQLKQQMWSCAGH